VSFIPPHGPSPELENQSLRATRDAQLRAAESRARHLDGVTLPEGWAHKLLSKLLRRRP
jgi:hypothetical protein